MSRAPPSWVPATRTDPIPLRAKASGRVRADALQPGAAVDPAGDQITQRPGRGRVHAGGVEGIDEQRDELQPLCRLRQCGADLLARDPAAEQLAGTAV